MAEKKKTVVIRATKEETFTVLKAVAPGLFGAYVFTDVANSGTAIGSDPDDASQIIIEFNEEDD